MNEELIKSLIRTAYWEGRLDALVDRTTKECEPRAEAQAARAISILKDTHEESDS